MVRTTTNADIQIVMAKSATPMAKKLSTMKMVIEFGN